MIINKKKFIIAIIGIALIIISAYLSYQRWISEKIEKDQIIHSACLSENEVAYCDNCDSSDSFLARYVGWWPSQSEVTIYVRDTKNNKEVFRFTLNNVVTKSLSLEIHRCGIYVIRGFDFDKKEGMYKRKELWQYGYDGNGRMLIDWETAEKYLYSFAGFRVNPSESLLVLNQAYLDHPDYGIVVKNLKSLDLEDVFKIKPEDLIKKNPAIGAERFIGRVGWSSDGKYLWGGSESRTDYVYFRVDMSNQGEKNMEIFVMPQDAVHYGPPRLDTGYIWYVYGPPWVGFQEMAEEIHSEWRKEGKKKILFLYNLFTKEKMTVAIVDDPGWNFKPKWLSDFELEYEMPGEGRKIYKIER